ncbi:MAG: response regulator [Candidatus Krumholzibacteriia bacterium]
MTRLLLVEDNDINRSMETRMLQKLGYDVDAVANGADALVVLEQIAFHAVLLDIQMPVMDGYATAREIRARGHADLPLIAITAHAFTSDRERCLAAGMNDYLAKPVTLRALGEMVGRWAGAAGEPLP